MEAINKLMYQLSHLQVNSHWNYFVIGIAIVVLCLAVLLLFATYQIDKESDVPWRTWAAIGMLILITFAFCMSATYSNPFKYQTINQSSITKLKQAKADVKAEYPYSIILNMNSKSKLNPDAYVLLFKNFNTAKNTSTYLNTAISSDNGDGKTIFLHPNKDTVILKCTTKTVGNDIAALPIFEIKNYQKLTNTKIINVSRANYQLTSTNKMDFYWMNNNI